MTTIEQLTPLQRDAIAEAARSRSHALVRRSDGWRAETAPNPKARLFTIRLIRMLDRAWLVDLDQPEFPTRATLTAQGLALADQLRQCVASKVGAA